MMNRYNIMVIFHICVSYAVTNALDLNEKYGINEECSCSFDRLPQDSSCVANPDCYPTHRSLGITSECLPTIPINHQVCFSTRVKSCRNTATNHCRFFPTKNPEFELRSLNETCDSVQLSSVAGSDVKTFCMYNVNLSSNINCTALRLQHIVDFPVEEYVDNDNITHSCSHNSTYECKDYLQIYYEEGNSTQSHILCREELATLEMILPTTSFVAIYWTDSTTSEDFKSSFHLRAECLDSNIYGSAFSILL